MLSMSMLIRGYYLIGYIVINCEQRKYDIRSYCRCEFIFSKMELGDVKISILAKFNRQICTMQTRTILLYMKFSVEMVKHFIQN